MSQKLGPLNYTPINNPIFIEYHSRKQCDVCNNGRKKVYMIGLPTKEKGIEDYHYLASKLSAFSFYWYCNNVAVDTLEKYGRCIKFRVGLNRITMFEEISQMDLFCGCSHYENFPLTVGEDMAMGIPVIIYKLNEVEKVYKNTIQYVEYLDREQMLINVRNYLENNVYLGNREKAKKLIEENYSPEKVATKVMESLLN